MNKYIKIVLLVASCFAVSLTANAEGSESNNTMNIEGDTTSSNVQGEGNNMLVKVKVGADNNTNTIDVDQTANGGTSNNTLNVKGNTNTIGSTNTNTIKVRQ